MKILLIDDEDSIIEIFSAIFKKEGFEVITAKNGKDGIDKAQQQKPNIVLLDQILPDMNGNQVLEILKKDPATKNIPIAILSNYSLEDFVHQAINLGASDYIFKYQIDPSELVGKVNQIMQDTQQAPVKLPQ